MSEQVTESQEVEQEVTVEENRRALAIQIASKYAENVSNLLEISRRLETYLETGE